MFSLTRDQILQDIETLYQLALDDGQLTVALRAKEMQGKALGVFQTANLPKILRIADMTEEQLLEFIDRLEKMDPSLVTVN